jgi:hypothetical protein
MVAALSSVFVFANNTWESGCSFVTGGYDFSEKNQKITRAVLILQVAQIRP